jgi:hypothetical protein
MFLFLLKEEGKDKEFTGEVEEEVDLEDTIDEQEKHERKVDYSKELRDLEDEGDLPMDELMLCNFRTPPPRRIAEIG